MKNFITMFFLMLSFNTYALSLSSLVGGSGSGVEFLGGTTLSFQGNFGGHLGANKRCQVDYPNSHFCSIQEFRQSGTASSTGLLGSYWAYTTDRFIITGSGGSIVLRHRFQCGNGWSSSNAINQGSMIRIQTGDRSIEGTNGCESFLKIACCK